MENEMRPSRISFFGRARKWAARPIFPLTLFFFAFYYATFFPGILREDSSDQLGQALRHQINDWHSPVMTLIWSWTNRVYVGPAGMLFISDFFLFLGLGIILGLAFSSWKKQLNVFLLLTLFPINFCVIGSVTKTSFFCSTMLVAIALAALQARGGRFHFLWGVLALPLLFLAIAIRPDGVAAAFPVFGWIAWTFFSSLASKRLGLVLVLALLGSLGCSFLVGQVNARICHGEKTHPEQVFLASDLVALSLEQNRLLVPAFALGPGVDLDNLRAVYYPCGTSVLYWGLHPPLRKAANEAEFQLLATAWKREVAQHPFLYLQDRAEAAWNFLGPDGIPYAAPTFSVWNNTWGYFPSFEAVHADFHPGILSSLEVLLYYYSRECFFERPYFFVLLGLLNIAHLSRQATAWRDHVSLLLTASGLAHLALMFFFTPDPDYRYSSWLIFSSSLGCLLTMIGRWPARRTSPDAPDATFATCPEKSSPPSPR